MKIGVFWQNLGNPMVYYPKLAKATGGVTAAVFFSQLFQRQSQLSNPHEWVRISCDEIENETGLSRTEQELARRLLVEQSLLKERLVSGTGDTLEFWPDIDALEERLENFWKEVKSSPSFNTRAEVAAQQSSSDKLGLRNSTNNIYSEITTETLVEVRTQETLDKNNYIDSNGCSASRITSRTEKPHPALAPTHAPNVVVEGSSTPTPTVKTDKFFPVQRQPIAVKVTPNYQFSGPWNSPEQFEEFQRALLEYFKNKGVENPGGWVFKIVDGMTKGLVSPFWDEFVAGIPLGESQRVKRDWEIQTGVPYPAFEEERIQYYIHKGEPLEVAVSKARSDLRDPVLGKDLWDGFLRKCDRIADEAIKAKNLGMSSPYLPPSFTDKPPVTKQSVMNKLAAVAPQFSLSTSSLNSLTEGDSEQQQIEDEAPEPACDIPTLSSLQQAYKTPMGRTLVARQIAEHPEWGYGIVDGQVVDLMPF